MFRGAREVRLDVLSGPENQTRPSSTSCADFLIYFSTSTYIHGKYASVLTSTFTANIHLNVSAALGRSYTNNTGLRLEETSRVMKQFCKRTVEGVLAKSRKSGHRDRDDFVAPKFNETGIVSRLLGDVQPKFTSSKIVYQEIRA